MINNFMIGMHGKYDLKKYNRDFRKGFYGIQACLIEDINDIKLLSEKAQSEGFKLGIHFPLRGGTYKLRDPQFLSLDAQTRIEAYRSVEEELEFINKEHIKVDYILFHYPKPVILKDSFDIGIWRFADPSEFVLESLYPIEELKKHSEYLFSWLSRKSLEYNFTPVLEFDGINKFIINDKFLEDILEKYKSVKLCLDTGRIHLQSRIDPDFNGTEFIKRFSKYTEVIHLWNVKVEESLERNHYPVLPNLNPEDGWAPIESYLNIIMSENNQVKIMFEHRSDLISDEELDMCYSWISSITIKKNTCSG